MAGSTLQLRATMAAVGCRQFASSSSSPSPSPAWLMLPSKKMYSLGEKKVVNINKKYYIEKESESEWDHVAGSSHGWVGLFKEEYDEVDSSISGVSVWNPMSGDRIKLPPVHTIPNPDTDYVSVEKLIVSDAECSRVVIVGSSAWLGVCCPGRCSEWTLFAQEKQIGDLVMCSQRKFYSLHYYADELVRWDVSEPRRPRMEWKSSLSELGYDELAISTLMLFPRKPDRDSCYSEPHLVYAEHSDQLFIVTRHSLSLNEDMDRHIKTVAFDVHLVDTSSGKLCYMKHSLDGLVMFVGLNDSFAVPAADFPHFKPDSIYFTDHHEDILHGYHRHSHDIGMYDYKNDMLSSFYYPHDHHKYGFNPIHPHPFWFTPTSTKSIHT